MKLYLIHCGFYDPNISDGIYESHINLFVAANSFDEAKLRAKSDSEYKNRKMHVDGIQEISRINGYDVLLSEASSSTETIINNKRSDFTG